jgi:hypothetical protein
MNVSKKHLSDVGTRLGNIVAGDFETMATATSIR